MIRRKWKKTSLALSAFLFVLWWALGTSATMAWFSDHDMVRNEFQIGLLKLDVSYKNDIVTDYTPMDGSSKVFNDAALYEPGYTQVVYLKLDNKGDVDFKYKVAVTVQDFTNGRNAWGEEIYLPNYLRYGVVFGESEQELRQELKKCLDAKPRDLNDWGALDTWSEISPHIFEAGEDAHYAALIVHMPEEVGNAANYRGFQDPEVILGVTVFALQSNAPLE